MTTTIVRAVDRLYLRTNQPDHLFSIFNQQLLLPEAWPLTNNPFYLSGGIHLGNTTLDIVQIGHRNPDASFYGLAFEINPVEESLQELVRRNIPHTHPLPLIYYDSQGWQVIAWYHLFLGGLLEDSLLRSLFFRMNQKAAADQWERRTKPTPFNRVYGLRYLTDVVFRRAITVGIDYNPAWQRGHIRKESDNAGLELIGVYEVTIGVRNLEKAREKWNRLLDPIPEIANGIWRLSGDLHIRLVQHQHDDLLGMIWLVSSLNRAAQFLNRRGLLASDSITQVAINPAFIGGLQIRLIQ